MQGLLARWCYNHTSTGAPEHHARERCGCQAPHEERAGEIAGKSRPCHGASRGIGRAIAVGLAAEGAHVAINYVSRPDAAVAVQEAIGALGREGLPVQADVAVAAEVERMVAQVWTALDRSTCW